MALSNGHCCCVNILLQTGCELSNPVYIWTSEQWNGMYSWIGYSPDVVQLLLVATPDFAANGSGPTRALYETFMRTMKSPELIKIFFMSGNKLKPDEMQGLLKQVQQAPNKELFEWLLSSITCVSSLQHWCRLAIRRALRPNVMYAYKLLPVPARVQEYLVFAEKEVPASVVEFEF